MSIHVKQLTKIYGEQFAVKDISFSVEEGEIVGFLGPNGAGKSTTMKVATCYLPPTRGTVEVCGFDVEKETMEVRKRVGYLPEHNPLYLDMYVKEALGFAASVFKIKGNRLKKRIDETIELVGLQKEKHKKVGALSKGYRQRVGLAQALIHDPKVLILDEPTTGLDPNQIVEIREVIRQISTEKTVLFSSHIMQEVQALCQRVVIINNGQLVADEKLADLSARAGRHTLQIEFEKPTDPAFLLELEGVESLEKISESACVLHYPIETDIRAEVFRKTAEKGAALVRMEPEENSLEAVFQQLTR